LHIPLVESHADVLPVAKSVLDLAFLGCLLLQEQLIASEEVDLEFIVLNYDCIETHILDEGCLRVKLHLMCRQPCVIEVGLFLSNCSDDLVDGVFDQLCQILEGGLLLVLLQLGHSCVFLVLLPGLGKCVFHLLFPQLDIFIVFILSYLFFCLFYLLLLENREIHEILLQVFHLQVGLLRVLFVCHVGSRHILLETHDFFDCVLERLLERSESKAEWIVPALDNVVLLCLI